MAGVGEHEAYLESRLRERRLQAYPHWDEIQVRLQHRWTLTSVIAWHEKQWPGEPVPSRMTLWRYLKTKSESWFVSRLVLAESGKRSSQRLLVAEHQAEMIESQKMRLAAAREFEVSMNGLLIPEVTKNFDLLDRMLVNHFRVLQEMGIEPKRGSMLPNAAAESGAMAEVGRMSPLIERLVQMPKPEFLELMRRRFPDRFAKAPLAEGEVIEAQATEAPR